MHSFTQFLLVVLLITAIPSGAHAAETCLPNQPAEVACLDDSFATVWRANGGLAVFGYALTTASPERNADAPQEFVTQWTERIGNEMLSIKNELTAVARQASQNQNNIDHLKEALPRIESRITQVLDTLLRPHA